MTPSQEFLRRAALAERAADAVADLGFRDRMLTIALAWRDRAGAPIADPNYEQDSPPPASA